MIQYPPEIQTLLRALYSEEGRYYHGMNHIKYLLANARTWFTATSELQTYQLLQHAIWWHDAVYSVFDKPGRNEIESATLFSKLHTQGKFTLDVSGMDEGTAAWHVWSAIHATARHLEDIDFTDCFWTADTIGRKVAMLMLDVDLSVFAEELDMVKHHSELVLQEYEPFGKSRESMLEGRISFLKKLLERKRIFYTDFFYERCEQKARFNLQDSIEATEEELEDIRTTYPRVMFERPTYDHEMASNPLRDSPSKRFTNHAGLRGWVINQGDVWRLDFDDGTSWYVGNIDNLTIEE